MNKLDKIIEEVTQRIHARGYSTKELYAKEVALEFAKHILEEAAENAERQWVSDGYSTGMWQEVVTKQSITDTLNKYL